MAILGAEGFDQYTTGQQLTGSQLGTVENYSPTSTKVYINDTVTPRYGSGKILQCYDGGYIDFGLQGNVTNTMYVSFGFYTDDIAAQPRFLIYFQNASGNQAYLYLNANGTIGMYGGGTLHFTTTNALSSNNWYWIEVKYYCHASAGAIELWVNGVQWGVIAGVDTQLYATTPLINNFRLPSQSSAANVSNYYDDLIWQDDAGDFLGDTRIETFMPTAESSIQWTPSAGLDNSALVDEIGANDDTDYVSSSTVNDVDLYDVGAISADDTIHAVVVHTRPRKTDAGTRSMQSRTKSGTDEQGGAERALQATYLSFQDVFEVTDSAGAGTTAWTKTLFDAAQFGIKLTV